MALSRVEKGQGEFIFIKASKQGEGRIHEQAGSSVFSFPYLLFLFFANFYEN